MIMEKRKEIERRYTKDKEGEKLCNGSNLGERNRKENKKNNKKKREPWPWD